MFTCMFLADNVHIQQQNTSSYHNIGPAGGKEHKYRQHATTLSSQRGSVASAAPSCVLTLSPDDGSCSVKSPLDVAHSAPHSCCKRLPSKRASVCLC